MRWILPEDWPKDPSDYELAMLEQMGCICPPGSEIICDVERCPRRGRNGPTWDGRGCG